eukprot:scaffold13353_cov310-Alexandrium_tamarense.AAC.2
MTIEERRRTRRGCNYQQRRWRWTWTCGCRTVNQAMDSVKCASDLTACILLARPEVKGWVSMLFVSSLSQQLNCGTITMSQ